MQFDAAMSTEEKWQTARKAFVQTNVRINQLERENLRLLKEVGAIKQLIMDMASSFCNATSDYWSKEEVNAGSQ